MFNNQIIAGSSGAAGGGFYSYSIDQSLRFNDDDTAYLNRTPASAGNRKTSTLSVWVKRSKLGADQVIFTVDAAANDANRMQFRFGGGDELRVAGQSTTYLATNAKFRDVSSWYHIVLAIDTTQATASDRLSLYVNGEKITSLSASSYPSQNADLPWNLATLHGIGSDAGGIGSGNYFDGYMAEVNFIDGTALDPTSFGETINGIWVPKEYDTADGAYGTNGFYLSFADSAAIGDDLSGNTNDFTANNLVASDVVLDSPTNSFCTMNILDDNFSTPKFTYFEGNLKYTYSYTGAGFDRVFGTHMIEPGDTNKYYMEFTGNVTNEQMQWGIVATDSTTYSPSDRTQGITAASDINTLRWASYTAAPYLKRIDGDGDNALTTTNGNAANGDIFSIVYDAGAGKTFGWFNGVEFSGQDYSAGTSLWTTLDTTKTYAVMMYQGDGGGSTKNGNMTANFGQDSSFAGAKTAQGNTDANGIGDFYYAVPTDAVALCSANLPEVTIGPNSTTTSDEYFTSNLWTGTGSDQTITTTFAPDFVWVKCRSTVRNHRLVDTVRGATLTLSSDLTDDELTEANHVKSFSSTGFTVGGGNGVGASGETHVGWSWKAGGTAVSNTDGTITSQVSAAPDAGFSIVSWTGNGTNNATIGHGLSQTPDMVIVKNRSNAFSWLVWHKDLSGATYRVDLQATTAQYNDGVGALQGVGSSVITLGSGNAVNQNTANMIAYAFHDVDSYLKCGSYVGNANADGTFVYTGFRPAFVILKASTVALNWLMYDNARNEYNVIDGTLYPNLNNAEATGTASIDFLSNGFKIRNSGNYINQSGQTFIYLAFAEAPFKYANAR